MRLLYLLLFALLSLSTTANADVTPFDDSSSANSPFGSSQSIPPVSKAMPLRVVQDADAGSIMLQWVLLDNVYLYRSQLKLTPLDADKQPLAFDKKLALPTGEPHHDLVYGKTEVYFNQLTLEITTTQLPAAARFLRIQYQGCLDKLLCYPPQEKNLPLSEALIKANSAADHISTTTEAAGKPSHTQQQTADQAGTDLLNLLNSADANDFANWASSQSLGYVLLLFFLGGVLMAFTPCVFPMFPILLGILAGDNKPSATRGFAVSLAYVLGMAVPYTLAGLLVALSGARINLQAWLQQPAAIIVAALIFAALALSMFGLYELQLPARLRNRLGSGRSNDTGSLTQATLLGAISGLIVSPCITPVLAGALLFVALQGQLLSGSLALFVLAMGMGVPLLIIGAGGASLLPRAGSFMEDIKRFFGLVLLLMAIWLLSRLLPASLTLWLYGITLFIYAILQGAFDDSRRLRQAISLLLLCYALLLMLGAAAGGQSPFAPLAPFNQADNKISSSQPANQRSRFETLDAQQLAQRLAQAEARGTPVLIDFFADWCSACKELEKTTLSNPAVLAAMQDFALLRVNITEINAANRQLMRQYQILGLPCLVFIDSKGEEIRNTRVLGYMNSQQWLKHLEQEVMAKI